MPKYAMTVLQRVIGLAEGSVPPLWGNDPQEHPVLPVQYADDAEVVTGMYYDPDQDRFLTAEELPAPEPTPVEPPQPTNADIAQAVSDLEASLIIAGVI